MLDISFIVFLFYLVQFKSGRAPFYTLGILFFLLNLINFSLSHFYKSGIVNFSYLIDYTSDALPLLQTGESLVPIWYSIFIFILPALLLIHTHKAFASGLKTLSFTIGKSGATGTGPKRINIPGRHLFLAFPFLFYFSGNYLLVSPDNILGSNVIYRMITLEIDAYQQRKNFSLLERSLQKGDTHFPDRAHFESLGYKFPDKEHPLLKLIKEEKTSPRFRPNFVFIMLESVAAKDTGFQKYIHTPGRDVTPFLDSLIPKSVSVVPFFSNSDYTAGAEVASFCSMHDSLRYSTGKGSILRNLTYTKLLCLPEIFRKLGYSTSFFHSYTTTFDNKHIFFPLNGVEKVIDRDHEAFKGLKHTYWGILDEEMFRYGVKYLTEIQKPFFSIFLTVNNHTPFILHDPSRKKEFEKKEKYNDYLNTVNQTDDALRTFFRESSKQSWYENTVFIITSDNGILLGDKSIKEINWERFFKRWHLVPFLIYSPSQKFGLKPRILKLRAATHVDIPPTVLDIIDLELPNPFVGESLLSKNRKGYTLIYDWFANFYRLSWPYVYHNTDHQMFDLRKESEVPSQRLDEYHKWVETSRDFFNYLIYKDQIWK